MGKSQGGGRLQAEVKDRLEGTPAAVKREAACFEEAARSNRR